MTIYKLKEVLDSQYNRSDVKRHHRSVLFLIQNTVTGNIEHWHMSINKQITDFTELLTCLGNANTSEFVLDQIPKDYLYLNDIFQ